MAHRGVKTAYGDLYDRRKKMDSKYDPEVEKMQIPFLEQKSGVKYTGDFQGWLKNGVVLCKTMNAIRPGSCRNVHEGTMAFKQMENISQFLSALPTIGVRTEDGFQTADLFEGTNMSAVQVCIENVRRVCESGKPIAPVPQKVALPTGSNKFGAAPASDEPRPAKAGAAPSHAKYSSEKRDDAAYGDLAERMARMNSKYDMNLEGEIREWIKSKTSISLDGDFQEALKDGTTLCALANAIQPGAIAKVNKSSLAFKQMENINQFVDFARSKGVRSDDLFQTVDLYEGSNMVQVLQTLSNLKRITA